MGFVRRTLGCRLDARNLISQMNSEDVFPQFDRTRDPYYPMSELPILGIRSGWGIWIRHYERIRHFLREIVSFAGAIGVREREVHRGDYDVRFVEGILPEQGVPRFNFAPCGVCDGEEESRSEVGRKDIWDDPLPFESDRD